LPRDTELGNGTTVLILRSIPLRPTGELAGGLVLLRDVTDLRRRDRELVTKDATIREIHHRVKNNLQTVAALLRLQARRIDSPEGREALEQAVRRVGSIAIVHETLSQSADDAEESVDFDVVVDQLRRMAGEGMAEPGRVRTARTGSFGAIPSEVATPLAMALTELLQNAVEHGFGRNGTGSIEVACSRAEGVLRASVTDDGQGVPVGFDAATADSLGLSIVRTLTGELGGSLRIGPRDGVRGTVATIEIPVSPPADRSGTTG
jgi:two-component sensor histidine kinase